MILEDVRILILGVTEQSYSGKMLGMCAMRNWLGCGINECGYCNGRIKGRCEVGFSQRKGDVLEVYFLRQGQQLAVEFEKGRKEDGEVGINISIRLLV